MGCTNCFHQQCCDPHVPSVPEGEWLCHRCEAVGNQIDPQVRSPRHGNARGPPALSPVLSLQVLEDARNAQEAMGGEERVRVVRNDGYGEQDIELLMEMLDVSASRGSGARPQR